MTEKKEPVIPSSILKDWFLGGRSEPIFTSESSGPPRSLAEALLQVPSVPLPPPPIQDKWFKDQVIYVDGYTFERCRFDRCRLVTNNGTFIFRQCFISLDCKILFGGPTLKVARLLTHYLRAQGRVEVKAGEEGVFSVIHPDGTFSIE